MRVPLYIPEDMWAQCHPGELTPCGLALTHKEPTEAFSGPSWLCWSRLGGQGATFGTGLQAAMWSKVLLAAWRRLQLSPPLK